MVNMDISRKLYKDDIIILNELQNELLRQDVKTTQKELIDKAVRFAVDNKGEFFEYMASEVKDNTSQKVKDFLSKVKRVDLGKRWLEEIDTTL